MKKEKKTNNFTYLEKATMLYNYSEGTQDCSTPNVILAHKMSKIICEAVKLNDNLCTEVIDEIIDKHTVIKMMPYTPTKPTTITSAGPKVLACFKPTIVSFTPDELAFEKVDILFKYINHEMAKKEQNTCNYSIKE